MKCSSIAAGAMLALLIGVTNSGNVFAAHGGGGMGGGGMHGGGMSGGGFRSSTGSGFRGYSGSAFNGGGVNRSLNGSFVSHSPTRSFNENYRASSFGANGISHGNNFVAHEHNGMSEHFSRDVQHPVNPQTWHNNANWWRNNFAADHEHGHDHDFDHFHHFHNNFAFIPFWWDYGPFYSWYGHPYYDYYSDYGYPTDYYYTGYGPDINNSLAYVDSYSNAPADSQGVLSNDETSTADNDWAKEFMTSALDAFRSGDYTNALRLANHAVEEMPRDAKAHELMSLAFFALKDYARANIEAHAALSLAAPADWKTLYGYYGDLPTYSKQLDALADHIRDHKDATDARFVLAYQNLMMGHKEAAKKQFEDIAVKIPKDQVAAKIVTDLGGSAVAAEKTAPVVPMSQ